MPEEQAHRQIVLQLSASHHEAMAHAIQVSGTLEAEAALAALEARLRFQRIAIDRVLGLPDGSVVFTEPGVARAVIATRRAR